MTFWNPFQRKSLEIAPPSPAAPSNELERNAVEDSQVLGLEAQIANHLTEAAILRTRLVKNRQEKIEIENQQIVSGEARELYGRIERMTQAFKRVGIPGIKVEVLRFVDYDEVEKAGSTITLAEYVGEAPQDSDLRYKIVDHVRGWLIPGKPSPFVNIAYSVNRKRDPKLTNSIFRMNAFYDGGDKYGSFSQYSDLLLTEQGRNWSWMLTPSGVTDGSIKGVVMGESGIFSKGLTSAYANEFDRQRAIDTVQSRVNTMLGIALQYGYTEEALLGGPDDKNEWNTFQPQE